jgi:hypothetical protein
MKINRILQIALLMEWPFAMAGILKLASHHFILYPLI